MAPEPHRTSQPFIMTDLPEPTLVGKYPLPGRHAHIIVIHIKTIGYVGLASNVPTDLVEGPYESAAEARSGATRMEARYRKGDAIDAYTRGRETKNKELMERAWRTIQARMGH